MLELITLIIMRENHLYYVNEYQFYININQNTHQHLTLNKNDESIKYTTIIYIIFLFSEHLQPL